MRAIALAIMLSGITVGAAIEKHWKREDFKMSAPDAVFSVICLGAFAFCVLRGF